MLEWVVERLISLLGPIATAAKDKRELKDNALRAVSTALQETKIYYRGLDEGKPRNADTENQLSKYWAAAAIPLRHFDVELAVACDEKSNYWLSPGEYSAEDVRRLGIRLSDVSVAYRRMIAPGFSTVAAKRRLTES